MNALHALVLGLVEGFTEYLPISSTGHLILASHWLGLDGEASAAFDIVIQLGAILAVLVHYRSLLAERARGLLARDPKAQRLFLALVVAFIPTAIAGLLLRKIIKAHLFGAAPVAVALIVGGVFMIAYERFAPSAPAGSLEEDLTLRRAFLIGCAQCVALVPGASRSMCTILGGRMTGLSTRVAAEFSFLLGLPTLAVAALYEGVKSRHVLMQESSGMGLVIGLTVSFVVAWAVIAVFIRYLERRGLEAFGWYRILLGGIVVWLTLG